MKAIRYRSMIILFCTGLLSCNQPFEPQGPVNNKLVLYSMLTSPSDTQYVRLSTTYGDAPAPDVADALVQLVSQGRTILFKDTTVQWTNALGVPSPTHVYVAYHAPVNGGTAYQIRARTARGLAASANATALGMPSFSIRNSPTRGFFTLDAKFTTLSGAFVMHCYVDYYALVDGAFELHREEVPIGRFADQAGNVVFTYPQLSLVQLLPHKEGIIPIQFDSTLYTETRGRAVQRYQGSLVVFFQIVFSLTQIDDVLYSYYYFNNGPVDKSTIRLDQPDFTNVENGYGVFGSRVQVVRQYHLE